MRIIWSTDDLLHLKSTTTSIWHIRCRSGAVHSNRDASARLRAGACELAVSGHGAGCPVEQLAGFQHRVHDDGQLARNGDGRTLEADPLSQLQPPGAQLAFGIGARQDHGCCFIKQSLQMSVAASGDVAVIIDFPRLVATSGQSQPRADRTRLLEVRRVLDGGRERGCGDRANPGIDISS